MNANRFAASIIRVETGQTVADRGPYRVVRHPMYTVAVLTWVWVPLVLGSFIALPAVVFMMVLFVWRLLNEERILRKELPGYVEYCQPTPYRLIPFAGKTITAANSTARTWSACYSPCRDNPRLST